MAHANNMALPRQLHRLMDSRLSMLHIAFTLLLINKGVGKCPEVHDAGTLSFTKNLTSVALVRSGREITIECCATGFDRISWTFRHENETNWLPFPFYHLSCLGCENGLVLNSQNQSLMILRSGGVDKGNYSCHVTNSTTGNAIVHYTKLDVYDCTDRGKPLPIPPHNTYTTQNANATFTCGGDFGCKDSGLRGVDWYIDGTALDKLNATKYKEIEILKSGGTVVMKKLVISNVQVADFNRNFTCWVTSDYDQGNVAFTVHLKHIEHPTVVTMPMMTIIFIVVGAALFIVFTFSFGAGIHQMYGPQISLYCKSRVPWSSMTDKGQKQYHVFLCHGDEDQSERSIVENIRSTLHGKGYVVATMTEDNILGGQSVITTADTFIQTSASIVFVETNPLPEIQQIAESAKTCIQPKLITIVLKQSHKDNEFLKNEVFKNLYYVEWPGESCSARVQGKFFSSLQLRLPRIKSKRSRSIPKLVDQEEQPLLETPSTVSPMNDRVFDFDEAKNNEHPNTVHHVNIHNENEALNNATKHHADVERLNEKDMPKSPPGDSSEIPVAIDDDPAQNNSHNNVSTSDLEASHEQQRIFHFSGEHEKDNGGAAAISQASSRGEENKTVVDNAPPQWCDKRQASSESGYDSHSPLSI